MIYVENQIFTKVYDAIINEYPDAFVTGVFVPAPPKFPCVFFAMSDSAYYRNSIDSSHMENHDAIEFDVEIYSNSSSSKKTECYEIAGIVDDVMSSLNFTRMELMPIPNIADATIYRLKGRYRAIVGKDETLYRR